MSEITDTREGRTHISGRRLAKSSTNTTHDSCVDCEVSCEDLWSLTQMDSIVAMSERGALLSSAIRRAKRTAGQYAALYLADEGTPQAGRFYWPGLAAFAAKQVVEGIEYADKNLDSWAGQVRTMAAISFYYLLKGNLWVFFEVAPWMFFYRKHGAELFNHCVDRRDVGSYDTPVRDLVKRLPWASGKNAALERSLRERINVQMLDTAKREIASFRVEDERGALAEIGNCRSTNFLKQGFAKLQEVERTTGEDRESAAYTSALRFLDHEQRFHLQTMVYNHRYFRQAMDNNDLGRAINGWLWDVTGARHPELVFHSQPQITPEIVNRDLEPHDLKESDVVVGMSLKDGKLYDVRARMEYVVRILDRYHWLMQFKTDYMLGQLRLIEGWKDA